MSRKHNIKLDMRHNKKDKARTPKMRYKRSK